VKKILFILILKGSFLLLLIIFFNPQPLLATPPVPSSIIKKYQMILIKEGWKNIKGKNKNELTAYKYGINFQKLNLKIELLKKKGFLEYQLTAIKNKKKIQRDFFFVFKENKNEIEETLASYLFKILNKTYPEEILQNPFSFYYSAGYNKTRSDGIIPKLNYKGNLLLSWGLIYDPTKFRNQKKINLNLADYFFFNTYAVFEYNQERKFKHFIRDNYFNINFIISGTQYNQETNCTKNKISTRTGFYTGMEYFRPGYDDNVLLWTHDIYQKRPHVQYYLYRVASWEYDFLVNFNPTSYFFHFGAGVGPAMNSSLFATDFSSKDEDNRSDLFRSTDSQKQNYYYSLSLPISLSVGLDNFYRSKISLSYNLYSFYALDFTSNDRCYDFLQIFKGELGFYLRENLLLNSHYEFWQVNSFLNDDHRSHNWKKIIIELKYYM